MTQPLDPVDITTCYRHPDRRAGVRCQRCDRPICPSCMVQASVGFHCPECTKQGAKRSPVITARSLDVQPYVTQGLIALNAVVFVISLVNGGTSSRFTADYALLGGFSQRGYQSAGVAFGEWYRLFTGAFLHENLLHIGMNMVVLWLIGAQLERALGHAKYAVLYLASLLAGSFAVMLVDPGILTIGASGAIFGLMGAAFALQRSRGINPLQSGLATLIVLNLALTFVIPGISIAGHVGGLVGGAAVGWVLFEIDQRTRGELPAVAIGLAFSALFFVGGLWAASYWAAPLLKL